MKKIKEYDPELWSAMEAESQRQRDKLELIASENYTSSTVREAVGSILTNKYAEGYPGKRYYGGCEFVDIAENLARDRAKQLFGCDYANVQPHAGMGVTLPTGLPSLFPASFTRCSATECAGKMSI